jgi:hypothetical protein
MKQNVPNIRINIREVEEKKRLANEINNLLPHVTDDVHMKTALTLNCEYKVVKAYLAGNIEDEQFAVLLIDVLGHIIAEGENEKSTKDHARINSETTLLGVAGLVQRTFRECKAIKAELVFLENKSNERFQRLQASVNEIASNTSKEVY